MSHRERHQRHTTMQGEVKRIAAQACAGLYREVKQGSRVVVGGFLPCKAQRHAALQSGACQSCLGTATVRNHRRSRTRSRLKRAAGIAECARYGASTAHTTADYMH